MKLVKMMGGLGNQLFQYSFARFLERELGQPVWLETLFFVKHRQRRLGLDDLAIRYRKSFGERYIWYKLNSKKFIRWEEKDFDLGSCRVRAGESMYFWGYWQKSEHARDGREGILEGFGRFKKRPEVKQLAEEILGSDAVSIHVRRGDYRTFPKFTLLGREYYERALEALDVRNGSKLFLFSDESGVEKDILPDESEIVRVSDYGLKDFEELYLMSLCPKNVIANSTFSWWAAFLNIHEKRRIVMPRTWRTVTDGFNLANLLFEDVQVI